MKILPMMNKGIPFLHEDGCSLDMVPFQVFRLDDGMTAIRIGRNMIWTC